MVLEGLLVVCASAVVLADPKPADERDRAVAATLAVQTALEQGRDLVLRGEYRAAVYVLENQLAHVNGNRAYLRTLQEAYRGYVKELRLAKQDAAAETYAKRLSILDPGSVIEQPRAAPPARPEATTPPAPMPPAPAVTPDAAPKTTVRMQAAEAPPAAPARESPAR